MGRLAVLVAVLAFVAVVAVIYRRRKLADTLDRGVDLPPLPAELTQQGTPTWVIFTTPYCASCDTVEGLLHEGFPSDRVVTIDATERPDLADRYRVRRAPTVIGAGPDGQVRHRLVGPESVHSLVTAA